MNPSSLLILGGEDMAMTLLVNVINVNKTKYNIKNESLSSVVIMVIIQLDPAQLLG